MTTSHAETAAFDWDTYLQEKSGRRATEVLRIFGQDYMTSATESANELYGAYMHNSLDAQHAKEQYVTLPPEEFKQIWGIATDFPVLNDYVTSHNNHPKLHSEQLAEAEVANEISHLLELAESINLETVPIGAAHCLALMETYDPRSAEVRAALSQAEFIYASL